VAGAHSDSGDDPRRHLAQVGLVVDWNPAWPILDAAAVTRRRVYQPIGDTSGIVFVRFAADDTLDAYLGALGGGRAVTIERDERVAHHGLEARRLRIRLPVGGGEMHTIGADGAEHHHEPLSADIIEVIGFRSRDTPVLAGYRVPVSEIARQKTALDAIIESVRPE